MPDRTPNPDSYQRAKMSVLQLTPVEAKVILFHQNCPGQKSVPGERIPEMGKPGKQTTKTTTAATTTTTK